MFDTLRNTRRLVLKKDKIFKTCTNLVDPGEKPSLEKLNGEKPSGENPSASFATCGEKPSPFFGACGEKPSISYNSK